MNSLKHVFELLLQFLILRSLVEFTDEMPACLKHLRTEAQRSVTKVLLPEGKDISSNPAAGASYAVSARPVKTHHASSVVSKIVSAGVHHPVIGIT